MSMAMTSILMLFRLFTAYRKCQQDDFHCGTGTDAGTSGLGVGGAGVQVGGARSEPCLPREKRCDGYIDCRSGRDEQGCSGVACRLDQYRCANGQRCIEASQKCDYKNDCGDNSDEKDCSKFFFSLKGFQRSPTTCQPLHRY